MSSIDHAKIAAILVDGDPLAFSLKEYGSLVVIAPNGMKFRFSPEKVASALPKPAPRSTPSPAPKPGVKEHPKPSSQRGKSPASKK